MEEECSATETLWCSPALEEPAVLSSSMDGAPLADTMSGPASVLPPSGAPFMGMYDDGVPPLLARTEPSADGVPPMLRRPEEPVRPRRHGPPSEFRPFVSPPSRLDGDDLELPIQVLDGASATMVVASEFATRVDESATLSGASDAIGGVARSAEFLQGYTDYQDDHSEESVMHMISGGGGALAAVAGALTPEDLHVSECIETVTDLAEGGTRIGLGLGDTFDGDAAHGVPQAAHGILDIALTAGELGLGPLGGIDPISSALVDNLLDHGEDGFEQNEALQTFGYEERPDGSRDGLNSFELAMATGTQASEGVHDWIAGDAAEGSALETAADVGGGIAGTIAGAGAGIIGAGGDLVAGYGLQSAIDATWDFLGVD